MEPVFTGRQQVANCQRIGPTIVTSHCFSYRVDEGDYEGKKKQDQTQPRIFPNSCGYTAFSVTNNFQVNHRIGPDLAD